MDEEAKKILDDHEKRILKLENHPLENIKPKKLKKNLSSYILELRDSGFFSVKKISKEVHEEISKKYDCEFNRVEVMLHLMGKRKELRVATKDSNGKNYKAYVW